MKSSMNVLGFIFLLGTPAMAQVSDLVPTSTTTAVNFQMKYAGTPTTTQFFIDGDRKSTTGFPYYGMGADYLVENSMLYRYSGTSGSWAWTSVKAITLTKATGSATASMARADLGSPAALMVQGQVSAPLSTSTMKNYTLVATTTNPTISAATSTATTMSYQLKYSGTPTYQKIYIDKDKSATTGFKVGTMGADFLLQNNKLYKYSGTAWVVVKDITYSANAGVANFTVNRIDVSYASSMNIMGQVQDPVLNTAVQTQTMFLGVANATCDFTTTLADCDLYEQSKAKPRASLVNVGGISAVRLLTLPGDSGVAGSNTSERDDLTMDVASTGSVNGAEQWWSHKVYFPADYVVPPVSTTWHWGLVFNFHNSAPGAFQANVQLVVLPGGVLSFWVAGGGTPQVKKDFTTLVKNRWYEFVYRIKWSRGNDGVFQAWMDGNLQMNYQGGTLYPDQNAYLKLANYHTPVGLPVAVVHSRLVRGTGPVVAQTPLK